MMASCSHFVQKPFVFRVKRCDIMRNKEENHEQ